MKGKLAWSVVVVLLVVIVVLAWILFATPKPAYAPTTATSTAATSTAPEPLHVRVIVTSPKANAIVGKTFTVTGEAPGNWYFEAVFPIQVRDKDNNKIGQAQGQAQSNWMTTAQVPFKATVALDMPYSGPAILVLLRDNPSGLPQNDDSVSIPITIQ